MRYLLAAFASVMFVGVVVAEEFSLQIMSINEDGSVTGIKITQVKGKFPQIPNFGAQKKIEKVTVKLARDVRVHMAKLDPKAEGVVVDGDDLKLAGLKAAILKELNGHVGVLGKAIGEKDMLEISVSDGKPVAKLNGKEIPFATVYLRQKAPLEAHVTTSDDGVATKIVLGRGFPNLNNKGPN
jgi:hypothetical protein